MGRNPSAFHGHLKRLAALALVGSLLFFGGNTGPALSQDMTTIQSGGRVEINAHGVCRRVHNGTDLGVMIPTRSPQEWATGGSSFLQNVPTGMTAYACVSPEVALRRWSRPGPPGQTGQPFAINGSDHGLTFTSVGMSTDGVTPSLVGNQIRYTPNSTRWRLDHLATALDTVPFEAIDSEGIAVQGNLRITLVGYDGRNSYLGFRYNSPDHDPLEWGDLGVDVPFDAKIGVRVNMILQVGQNIFDGNTHFTGLFSLSFKTGHFIVIDNSPASMAPYSGPPVGDVNGDGSSNTILDAQIRAALDFVDRVIAENQAEQGTVRLEGLNDPGEFMAITKYTPGTQTSSGVAGTGLAPIYIYTANGSGAFAGQTDSSSFDGFRNTARSALLSIRGSGSNLNTSNVFGYLDGEMARLVQNQFTMAIHFLSPGANSGAAPNLSRFNQTGSGQLGTPVFAYYTGGNAASSQASFMAGLDHANTLRHMNTPSVFGASSTPYPVTPDFRFARLDNGVYQPVRNPDGTVFSPQLTEGGRKNTYFFGFRLLPGTDTTCYAKSCQMAGVPISLIQNYAGLQTLSGDVNRFRMQAIMFMNPIYRVHYDHAASFFNSGGVLWNLDFFIFGGHTPLPPN
jgi:hypothetical protein